MTCPSSLDWAKGLLTPHPGPGFLLAGLVRIPTQFFPAASRAAETRPHGLSVSFFFYYPSRAFDFSRLAAELYSLSPPSGYGRRVPTLLRVLISDSGCLDFRGLESLPGRDRFLRFFLPTFSFFFFLTPEPIIFPFFPLRTEAEFLGPFLR